MTEAIYPFISAGFETAAGFICVGRTAGGRKVSAVRRFLFWLCGYGACWLPVPFLMRSLIFTAVLCLYGVWGKGEDGKHSLFSALLAVALTELCWGASNSAGMLLAPYVFDAASLSSGRLFMMGSDLAALGLSLLYSRAARYVLGRRQELPGAFYAPLLLPAGAAALAGEWMVHTGYGSVLSTERISAAFFQTDARLLVVQLLGAASLLSLLHLRIKLSEITQLGAQLTVSKQQVYFQKRYVEEARGYYHSTRSLRHDIRNHMAVVRGLLEKQEFDRAKAYLGEMEGASSGLSFPYASGNPVVDVLLEEKAALAGKRGVRLAVSFKAPFPDAAGDMELCTILSNALDNAIYACQTLEEGREVEVKSVCQGEMWLLSVENRFRGETPFRAGTGIANIRQAAADCGGTAKILIRGDRFCVTILMGYQN